MSAGDASVSGDTGRRIMLVTGMSGAGKTTALKTLEDLGWEAVDNFPIRLLGQLLATPQRTGSDEGERPLAIGFDARTRGFDPDAMIAQIKAMEAEGGYDLDMLFLDCSGQELERRYNETRRRHPLALDRPAAAGISEERDLLQPLRRWAGTIIDTSPMASNELQQAIRQNFSFDRLTDTVITIASFGFARGMPPSADLVFDMRFLRNPHWEETLRPMTGLDAPVADFIRQDPAFDEAMDRLTDLLGFLLPRYRSAGKAYVNIAIGCTGGRHRSVFVSEELSSRLREAGFCPTVAHRNLTSRPIDAIEGLPHSQANATGT